MTMTMKQLTVEHPFALVACCALLASRDPDAPGLAHVLESRTPDRRAVWLAVPEHGEPHVDPVSGIRYHVERLDPAGAGELGSAPFRRLVLHGSCREDLLAFVEDAIDAYRRDVRGSAGSGAPAEHRWDEDTWEVSRAMPPRPLVSVFLPDGVAASALADLARFLSPDEKARRASLAVEPVRTYLFHGSPGSGKSSLVHALASETGHGLARFACAPATAGCGGSLVAAVRDLPRGSFLVLEDVDCALAARRTTPTGEAHASELLAALLGVLDGVHPRRASAAGEPLVVFMTTNHPERLDAAVRRRVDYSVAFSPVTRAQCRDMFEAFGVPTFDAFWAHLGGRRVPASAVHRYLARGAGADFSQFDALAALLADGATARILYT